MKVTLRADRIAILLLMSGLVVFMIFVYNVDFSETTLKSIESALNTPKGRIEPLPEFTKREEIYITYYRDPFFSDSRVEDKDQPEEPLPLYFRPEKSSLVKIKANKALIKLSDEAVYWVESGDVLWGGALTVISIGGEGVAIKFNDDGGEKTVTIPHLSLVD